MEQIAELLKKLHAAFPLNDGEHHNVIWDEVHGLLVSILANHFWYQFKFDQDDLDNMDDAIEGLKAYISEKK